MRLERLGNIIDIQIGKTPKRDNPSYWGKGNQWVSIADLKSKVITQTKEEITDIAVREAGCKLIPKGTILLSFKLSIGKVAFAGNDLYTNEAICGLFLKEGTAIYPEYLYYALKNTKLVGSNIAAKGSTLNTGSLNAIKIPFPESFNNQIRIATILGKAETLIQQRKESIGLLDELVKSTFWEMFGIYEGRKTKRLESVADITSGLTKGKNNFGKKTSFVPYMRVANVQDGFLDLEEIKEIEATSDEVDRFNLQLDDLLLTEGGDADKLGRGALWKNQIKRCIFQNHIFRVRIINQKELDPTFLSYQTGSTYGKKYFLKSAKQTTGIASINSRQLKGFPVYLPPIGLQTKFAQVVEKVDVLREQYITSLTELENLYASLSQQAFKGELDLSKLAVDVNLEMRTGRDIEPLKTPDFVKKEKRSDVTDHIEPKYKGYGDPFDVDEETAKRQGRDFYKLWKSVYEQPLNYESLDPDKQNVIEQRRGTLYSFGWRTDKGWVNKTREAVADKLSLEELKKLEFRYEVFRFMDFEEEDAKMAKEYKYLKVGVHVLSGRKFGEVATVALQAERGRDPVKYKDKIYQLFFGGGEGPGYHSMLAFSNLDDLTLYIFLNLKNSLSNIFSIKFNYHSSVFRNRDGKELVDTFTSPDQALRLDTEAGIKAIENYFKQKKYVQFSEFSNKVKELGIKATYGEIKDFIFTMLNTKPEIVTQVYASEEYLNSVTKPTFNPPGGFEFSGNGQIYFVYQKTPAK